VQPPDILGAVIDPRLLREDPDRVREGQAKRGPALIEIAICHDRLAV
jgi:hypothetical protein